MKDSATNKFLSQPKASYGLATIWSVVIFGLLAFADARPWPHQGSDLPVDERLIKGHLANGIRYVILPWSEPPDRVSMQLLVEAGFLQETDRQIGLAHLLEHMAFNGTEHFSAGEMVEYFQRLGMAFGADTNAHTWWRETVYKLELPDASASYLHDGLRLLRDYAAGMLLESDEIESEKGIVLSELRERDTPASRAWRANLQFSLPESRIWRWREFGEMDVVRMADRQDLVDYYRKWYVPQNLVLIAVGNVDPDALIAKFNEYFADMPPGDGPTEPEFYGPVGSGEQRHGFFSHPDLPHNEVRIFLRRPIEARTETVATRMESIKRALANAIISRRFDRLARQPGSPLSSGYAYDYRWLDTVRFTGIGAYTRAADWDAALEQVGVELRRALDYGFSEAEFQEAKDNVLSRFRIMAERESTRLSRDLSADLVRAVRDATVFMDPRTEREVFVPLIDALRLADIEGAFREAWSEPERLVWVSGDFSPLTEASFGRALQATVEPPVETEITEFAYTEFGTPGEVVEDRWVEDLRIRQLRFANGVRLNLRQTDYEANRILVKVSFGDGQLGAHGAPEGVGIVAGNTYVRGGLGLHDFDDVRRFLAPRIATVQFGVEEQFFSLSGQTNNDDLLFQLQILAAYLVDPGWRPEALQFFSQQWDSLYNQLRSDPNQILSNQGARILASGDSRFGIPERSVLEARTLQEVAEWLEDARSHSYLEMTVVGDFQNADAVIAAVSRTFGALALRADHYQPSEAALQLVFPQGPLTHVLRFPTVQQFGITTVHWPTADSTDVELARRLSILGSILSDRMRVTVREEAGESYSPYAFNSSRSYGGYGFIRAYAGVLPANVDAVSELIFATARQLAEHGADADELLRAVEPVKSRIRQTRRTNSYWVNSVALRSQIEPQRLDWARSFSDFWDTITVEEINALAARYLIPDNKVVLQVLPQN